MSLKLFFSGKSPRKLVSSFQRHGISLTPRGEPIFGGEIVGRYELAASVLVVRGIKEDSPLVELLHLRTLE